MLPGTVLIEGSKTFTSWMPRMADNAIFSYEVVQHYAAATNPFVVKIFHKNTEDLGKGADASASWTATSNTHRATLSGLKELVRYQIDVSTGAIGGVYRIFDPTWFDTAGE